MLRRAAASGAAVLALLVFAAAAHGVGAPDRTVLDAGADGGGAAARDDGRARRARRRPPRPTAARRHRQLLVGATPETPPYAWNGRLFVVQNGEEGFCSATAIDSPSRRLVLTAGHCVNTGPRRRQAGQVVDRPRVRPRLQPRRRALRHLRPLRHAARAPRLDRRRQSRLRPRRLPRRPERRRGAARRSGRRRRDDRHRPRPRANASKPSAIPASPNGCGTCVSGSAGQDPVTFGLPGPSTVGVRCRWAPGASGGGWLIDGGQEIDGLNTYIEISAKHRTFGPYFSASTVGRLVAGRVRLNAARRAGCGSSGSRDGPGAGSRRAPGGGGRGVSRRSCSARVRGRSARNR